MDGKQFNRQIKAATDLMRAGAGSFISRRAVLGGVIGFATSEAASRLVLDPVVDDAPKIAPGRNFSVETKAHTLSPNSPPRIAMEMHQESGFSAMIEAMRDKGPSDRMTIAEQIEGQMAVAWQGSGIRQLWQNSVVRRPMVDRPGNEEAGRFLESRYARARMRGEAIIEDVRVWINRGDRWESVEYVGALFSDGRRVVGVTELLSVTSPSIAPRHRSGPDASRRLSSPRRSATEPQGQVA